MEKDKRNQGSKFYIKVEITDGNENAKIVFRAYLR